MPKRHVKLGIAICDFKGGKGSMRALVSQESIHQRIFLIRGHKVMLDSDLAGLYGVSVKRLNQAVRRNIPRFPVDFMFQLTRGEAPAGKVPGQSLRSQFVTLNDRRGRHRKYLPYAFTEQGVAMLSSVLRSGRAVQVNIAIMRAFVRLREMISTHKEFAARLALLEREVQNHGTRIKSIFEAIKQLTTAPAPRGKSIGFRP